MTLLHRALTGLTLLASLTFAAPSSLETAKPKIRAITGFVTIDAKSYPSQIQEAVTFLNQVRHAIENAGYQVSGIRISTQPFPEYTRGLSHAGALGVLRGIDDLAVKLKFAPNIGPAMSTDESKDDGTGSVDLLTEVLSREGNHLVSNIVTAGEDGIHWYAVRQAARVIHAWANTARMDKATLISPPSPC